jgi:hypothetical protein
MRQDVRLSEVCTHIHLQVFPSANVIFAGFGVLLSVCNLVNSFVRDTVTRTSLRQPRTLEQAKTLLSTSSSASKCFADVLRFTHKCHQRQR